MAEKRKPLPGDKDYKAGTTTTTVRINGKVKEVRTVKDAYGNTVYVGITDKLWGIF